MSKKGGYTTPPNMKGSGTTPTPKVEPFKSGSNSTPPSKGGSRKP
jgi:hypothetical protein